MDRLAAGRRLKTLRGCRSQQEVARANFISAAALGMYERGERIPRDDVKIRLAKYYDTTVQALFYAEE